MFFRNKKSIHHLERSSTLMHRPSVQDEAQILSILSRRGEGICKCSGHFEDFIDSRGEFSNLLQRDASSSGNKDSQELTGFVSSLETAAIIRQSVDFRPVKNLCVHRDRIVGS